MQTAIVSMEEESFLRYSVRRPVSICRQRPRKKRGSEADPAVPPPTLRVVDGEGGLIEITLELKARLLDKFLVFGLAGDGGSWPAALKVRIHWRLT